MSPAPFSTQLIGRTEKALNAILGRELAGTGVTEPQWVALNVTLAAGDDLSAQAAAARVADVLKVPHDEGRARVSELEAAGLLGPGAGGPDTVAVTAAGRDFHARLRARVTEITARLWGDVPGDDLDVAGRVLQTVLTRAERELA